MKIQIYSTFITVKIYINKSFKNFDQHAFKPGIIKTNLFNRFDIFMSCGLSKKTVQKYCQKNKLNNSI